MPRVIGALVGDIEREPSARTKYGLLFEAIGRHFQLIHVYDAMLRGTARLVNAIQTAHPNRRVWKERFYQNVPAFVARSKQFANYLQVQRAKADAVLQEGVLFDSRWGDAALPSVIYTDYTAALAARKTAFGRSPFNEPQRAEWIALERRAMQRAKHICVRGRFVRDAIISDYGIAPEAVTAIGGGVNLASLPDIAARDHDHPPTALFIGKDFFRKGGDIVLNAFARVRDQMPDARLVMLTAASGPDSLLRAGVEFVEPTWDRAVIKSLYRRADLFVLPSRLETWGDVLLEAMAFGLPCIGVAGEAMDEIISDGATGAIVPPNDAEALANQMTRLLSDRALCERLGRAGRARVESEFTWDCVVARLAMVVESAVNNVN